MLWPELVTWIAAPLQTTIDVLMRLLKIVVRLPASELRCEVAPVSMYHPESSLLSAYRSVLTLKACGRAVGWSAYILPDGPYSQ